MSVDLYWLRVGAGGHFVLVELVPEVASPVWGLDELGCGEMWTPTRSSRG